MLDELRVNDEQLNVGDIRQLENATEVAHFFAKLRYNVDVRHVIPPETTSYASSQDIKVQVRHHELIATDVDEDIRIYLFEVRSVTAKLRNELARGFLKTNDTKVLLVLTVNYTDLEFVYLERSNLHRSSRRGIKLTPSIRPIPLTVNRLNPDSVALRVLKRFTFTEADSDYQWEKLRSAYMLAEWSEEYFNNRALFSDYYLKQRLIDPQITPQWKEDVRPIGKEVFSHLSSARTKYTGKTEAIIRQGLFEPLFKQLGFESAANTSASAPGEKADYLLYAPSNNEQPIAAALTYVWNRNLDDVDESRDTETPDEIPGAIVVSLLEKQVAPWVIVTNGKLWRLYSSTASNKATNYYEIDLEEAIAANDQLMALKYWWLIFRREAFTGFLDDLLKNSADYAKELGDRLKDRVFVEIFPQFAKGFIADMRAKGVSEADIDLDTVFSGTMTFLYRLMFALYAESLELLPINDVHGYRALSLYRMKREIADAGGIIRDEAPDRLKKHYKLSSTDLYTRLSELFSVIDTGSDKFNLPTYNGGLFNAQTESGRFLAQYAIPDQYLALGLDRLTRDIDTKTQALVFIDFKSLGVRQLGSIYEGLLEFKLNIATEALAVTKEKGKEVYQPANKVKKPLATLAKGDVYLENDKQERKATGSYYTPDYIVKYIVKHTVGPVLDRKFEELRTQLHQAQKGYRDYAKQVEARRKKLGKEESPAVYWTNSEMKRLVDDCLNVRVLDPAMGSGHFLVEVVDYVSNRLIDFLNGWTENPVWHFIEQTRQDILDDMERQHVNIDAERLTRVALLKRAVLKRCIYGVDLNAMAVELAKVSLWLDAFTLGAPLSFLDHHLKHGNSLIGARIDDVQEALEGQQTLFSQNKFAGVMLATDLMRQVSYLSDNTVAQTRQSAQAYRDASDHLAPYKRMLDVYTSRWFGNAPSKGRKGAAVFDPTIEFLKRSDTQAWLEDPHKPENCLPADDYLKSGLVAQTALQAAEEKRFFHWELEFPEVFFAPRTPEGQDVQLNPNGGFDAVVGNPPYSTDLAIDDRDYFDQAFKVTGGGYKNLALFMLENGFGITKDTFGFIVPKSLTYSHGWWSGVELLWNHLTHALDPSKAWKEVLLEMTIVIADKTKSSSELIVGQLENFKFAEINITKSEWAKFHILPTSTNASELVAAQAIWDNSIQWREITENYRGRGWQRYCSDDGEVIAVRGDAIDRFSLNPNSFLPKSFIDENKDAIDRYLIECLIAQNVVAHVENPIDKIILMGVLSDGESVPLDTVNNIVLTNKEWNPKTLLALFNSHFISWYMYRFIYNRAIRTMHLDETYTGKLPAPRINFTTPANERKQLTNQITGAYSIGDNTGVLRRVQDVLSANQSDVVHDLLAHLAERMIELNKTKQAELKRFLTWLETRLHIKPNKDGSSDIDSLTGKTIIQGYLGDYQKGEAEISWGDFYYRLHQNRNRFAVSLSDIEGEIQIAYEQSLATLLPIKQDLARTDALIDKIVYRLYGLTDAEIELIERPQYEQALSDAKAQVVNDPQLKDDDEKAEKIAEAVLPAAKRFFERVDPHQDEAKLDADLPNWRKLPLDAQTFLLTGDYNLRSQPEHMDFSTSVVSYSKVVEVVLRERVFEPFRLRYTDADVNNKYFKDFMQGKHKLTLGNYSFILPSSSETSLRNFLGKFITNLQALIDAFKDQTKVQLRNKAAHAEVLTRDEALQIRAWAIGILALF